MTSKMKTTFFLLSSVVLALSADTRAYAAPQATNVGASMEMVMCPMGPGQSMDVYDAGNRAIMKANAYDPVKVFQGWGTNSKKVTINGSHLTLIRVQLPKQAPNPDITFYVYEGFVTSVANCQKRVPRSTTLPVDKSIFNDLMEDEGEEEGDAAEGLGSEDTLPPILGSITSGVSNMLKGLDSPACCLMPIEHKPNSYLSGMGQFGWGRRGRMHAGVDLYGRTGEKVRAVAAGQVIRAPYFFKRQTLAVDIKHEGGFVVRYGEIMGQNFGMGLGRPVTRGQQVGQMAKLACCAPMLHLEIYSGAATGKLSQKGVGKYHRRSDLVNPTKYIQKWPLK